MRQAGWATNIMHPMSYFTVVDLQDFLMKLAVGPAIDEAIQESEEEFYD